MKTARLILVAAWCAGAAVAARAANVDAWIEALATTEILCDARIVRPNLTVEEGVRATLAAVHAAHPGLMPLSLAATPGDLLPTRVNLGRSPDRRFIAADVLREIVGELRVELTDKELRLVKPNNGHAEHARAYFATKPTAVALWTAAQASAPDARAVDLASMVLRRARTVASGPVGYGGEVMPVLPAWWIVVHARDAEKRLRDIAGRGTMAAKFYAAAGLVAKGVRPENLPDLPFASELETMAGCMVHSVRPDEFYRQQVLSGHFGREIMNTVERRRQREAGNSPDLENFERALRREAGTVNPPVAGRVLFDEVARPAIPAWVPDRR